jgi:hypothetical protein
MATLMHEILLTRIFSVTMWYHYAFLAISIALFGMTVGALVVYGLRSYLTRDRVAVSLALSALLFGISIVFSFLTYASIPFIPGGSLVAWYAMLFTYVVLAVPFVFSGICVALALTQFERQIGKLYAADLAGAACGCLMVIYLLRVTDGPGAVLVAAAVGVAGAVCFALAGARGPVLTVAAVSGLVLAVFAAGQAIGAAQQHPPLRLLWVKQVFEGRPIFEKWNSFSRVRIYGYPNKLEEPFGWGLSSRYPAGRKVRELSLTIDADALTVLTGFDGDLNKLDYLRYDVTNLVHYIRPGSRVLVIGAGGGRDVLSALEFGQPSVVAVEINGDILSAVNGAFGDFTGHLDRDPRVRFVNDEARSYIARQRSTFGIIQISLIDTWAATAAGAFALTENSLYTTEAWKLFLQRLGPHGVLSVSRWFNGDRPAEMYRATALAAAALHDLGVSQPRDHIILVKHTPPPGSARAPVGTLLVSKAPFSRRDLQVVDAVSRTMRFEPILTPRSSRDPVFALLAAGGDSAAIGARLHFKLVPPTDDSPFFFHTLWLRDAFRRETWEPGAPHGNSEAIYILGLLLIVVLVLTFACIILPMLLMTAAPTPSGATPFLLFFACIGLGFMLVEVSQMQRLTIFLGHPTYSLSVVLFALLLSSGLGSYLTRSVDRARLGTAASLRLGLLLGVLALAGTLTMPAIHASQQLTTPLRILTATGLLFPLGLFMGMAFPLGMTMATARFGVLTPWFWGINGATSVCGSVVAVAIALNSSISTAFWSGGACYAAALLALMWVNQRDLATVRPAAAPDGDTGHQAAAATQYVVGAPPQPGRRRALHTVYWGAGRAGAPREGDG